MLHLYVRDSISGDEYVITEKEQLHHLTVVLRACPGDPISLFDPSGQAYHGAISQITKTAVKVQINSRRPAAPSRIVLTVACSIPKASGMDGIIDQLTQLGVDIIIPLLTERVVARPSEPERKLERWRKIALNAAEQSQRVNLPAIPAILSLEEVIQRTASCDLKLIPTLEGQTRALPEILRNFRAGQAAVLIGPEGDFSADEVQKALKNGFIPVSLGRNVLKVDTAAAAVAAVLKLSLPDT